MENLIVIFLGDETHSKVWPRVHKFSLDHDNWIRLADMQGSRTFHGCQLLSTPNSGEQIVVAGGQVPISWAPAMTAEIYSVQDNIWTSIDPIPTSSTTKPLVQVRGGNKIMMLDQGNKKVFIYDHEDTAAWNEVSDLDMKGHQWNGAGSSLLLPEESFECML